MEAIKFNISSNFGFFKNKEDISDNDTYLCIHKPAILGLLGSILGYKGFHDFQRCNYKKRHLLNRVEEINIQIDKENKKLEKNIEKHKDKIEQGKIVKSIENIKNKIIDYENQIEDLLKKADQINCTVEYYEKLKNIKISIVINNPIQTIYNKYNDATRLGITHREGEINNIGETILVKPNYTIYLIIDNQEIKRELFNRLKNRFYEYDPYFGRNNFLVDVNDVEIITLDNIDSEEQFVSSIFPIKDVTDDDEILEDEPNNEIFVLPTNYNTEYFNYGEFNEFTYKYYAICNSKDYFKYSNQILYFF